MFGPMLPSKRRHVLGKHIPPPLVRQPSGNRHDTIIASRYNFDRHMLPHFFFHLAELFAGGLVIAFRRFIDVEIPSQSLVPPIVRRSVDFEPSPAGELAGFVVVAVARKADARRIAVDLKVPRPKAHVQDGIVHVVSPIVWFMDTPRLAARPRRSASRQTVPGPQSGAGADPALRQSPPSVTRNLAPPSSLFATSLSYLPPLRAGGYCEC